MSQILTFCFVQAVAEIAKASKREASELLDQAEFYKKDINSKKMNEEKRAGKNVGHSHANNTVDRENIDSGEYIRCKEMKLYKNR